MQELLTFVAKSLVDHPDQVRVQKTEGPEGVILELNVAEEDMGKVIGKQGRIAKAIRSVVKAATPKDAPHVFVEIQRPLGDFEEPAESVGPDDDEADE
ncbi:MAG: KH domain-containing protein [Clostridia bacterium]|nr:KH domain-containing protein [Clostridia bacterium]